jgi:hemolysin D
MSVRHRIQAWAALWGRYREVFAFHWGQRAQLAMPTLEAHEADFLPAALSLQARPVSPAGRWVARILIALVLVALGWSVLGKIDIIVNAQGRVVPSDRTKTIASVEVASVHALHVSEGQDVKAGDVLVELDTRASDSERDKALHDEEEAQLQAARARALLTALDHGGQPHLPQLAGVAPARWADAQGHLLEQWRDYSAKLARLQADIEHYRSEMPIATQRAQDYKALAQTHDVSEHAWMEKEQARLDLEGQLKDAIKQREALTAETRKTAEDSLNEALKALGETAQDARRAQVHSDLLKLVSPVDGNVQQLTVHTVGGVVPAAQPLMQIVPKQAQVEVEASLENKDIGFVREGQEAQVKIDAFPYTKYGTIPAVVTHVSRDAIQDEKKGWLYSVMVTLSRSTMNVDGREVHISPGMTTSVEIKTGTRRVIEYVLSPLMELREESLHER